MGLFEAQDLFAQAFDEQAQRVRRGCSVGAVIQGIDSEKQIPVAERMVEARGPEIFADNLERMAEGEGNAVANFRAVRGWP